MHGISSSSPVRGRPIKISHDSVQFYLLAASPPQAPIFLTYTNSFSFASLICSIQTPVSHLSNQIMQLLKTPQSLVWCVVLSVLRLASAYLFSLLFCHSISRCTSFLPKWTPIHPFLFDLDATSPKTSSDLPNLKWVLQSECIIFYIKFIPFKFGVKLRKLSDFSKACDASYGRTRVSTQDWPTVISMILPLLSWEQKRVYGNLVWLVSFLSI